MMHESLFDRTARAIGNVPIRQTDDGINVHLGPPMRGALAAAALEAIRPELDRLHARIAELQGGQPTRVLPAKFITDAMAAIPDELPPDFA
ncbi:hypothetical protein HW130_03200 [Streptomyces sp. PKU-EA00015]|uniref:hypothetical protein n=1 Tax=Streptomyces sp. PKU-EA00015 TaxID=2748326 RepID=UPI0015A269B7|nr:hypothetical protein [Streptomyces sp. PKU-EA00015]NWF25279.1 hypothetical protein [Streptomyces sp. PKU-EA00015]